jgi:hypothetical protein
MNDSTRGALSDVPDCVSLGETLVKGRTTPVRAWMIEVDATTGRGSRNE